MPHQHPSLPLEIARRLRELADDMESIAIDMVTCPGMPDGYPDRASDMAEAAKIARQWAGTLQAHVAAAREDG